MNVEYKWDPSNCKYHRASHLQKLLSRSNVLRYSDGICWYKRWVAAARASLSALTSLRRLKPIIRAAVPCSEPPSAQFLCTYYLAPRNPHFSFGWSIMLQRRVYLFKWMIAWFLIWYFICCIYPNAGWYPLPAQKNTHYGLICYFYHHCPLVITATVLNSNI